MSIENLVLVGDSHLSGKSGDAGEALIPLFEENLPGVQIINCTQGGGNTQTGLELLLKTNLVKPFTALVLFGTNDAADWNKISLDQFTINYENIISNLKTKGAVKIILITPPCVNEHKQIPPGLSNAEIFKYSEMVKTLTQKYQLECLDLFSLIQENMKNYEVHYLDGVHLNSGGYNLLFQNLLKLIKS